MLFRSPYLALGVLNQRKQMEQAPAHPAQGSVKEQIEQSLMQPKTLPGIAAQGVPTPQPPQPQGIPSQMPQQLASSPQPTKMAGGGLTSVPMRKDMFNYAPGGIVAFDDGGDVQAGDSGDTYYAEPLDRQGDPLQAIKDFAAWSGRNTEIDPDTGEVTRKASKPETKKEKERNEAVGERMKADVDPRVQAMLADRKSTRLNSSHTDISRMPSSA